MNNHEIDVVLATCRDNGIPEPPRDRLSTRDWAYVFADRWGNWTNNRIRLLGVLSDYMTPCEYARTIRYVWSHGENDLIGPAVEIAFGRFGDISLPVEAFMSPVELDSFRRWPNTITVFRGCQKSTMAGFSWSLDQAVARTFATRALNEAENGSSVVIRLDIPKNRILCYFTDMGEEEVLFIPSHQEMSHASIVETLTR